jgi:hypothetical protein
MRIFFSLLIVIFLSILSCENPQNKNEQIAKQYCSSCHAFPDPSLLDKKTWDQKTLPEMAFRMGLDLSPLATINSDDHEAILKTIPHSRTVSEGDWEKIRQYYLDAAPDSIVVPSKDIRDTLKQFDVTPVRLNIARNQTVTLIEEDTIKDRFYIGTRPGKLFITNRNLLVKDSLQLGSAPSKIAMFGSEQRIVLEMGIMDPNEQPAGKLRLMTGNDKSISDIIDSLQRPVDFERVDLNSDGLEDYVICNFGNYTGALVVYKGLGNGKFQKHILQYLPGARRLIIGDFDGNKMPDILALMSQGDERIIMLYNQGNFQFRVATLLRFSPVYGSSYFDIADFNNDGKFDILYTNGDNADYSAILKPYHGVRIFLNNGSNDFKESWFYPMHGASQARVADFDEDGDLDIAAISFFPDFQNHPERGFIYFENTPDGYIPQITALGRVGRWLTMEVTDIDKDGDTDLLLGSLTFPNQVPSELWSEWRTNQVSILLLRNNLVKVKPL